MEARFAAGSSRVVGLVSSSAYGAVAEHQAVVELLRRGFRVARPVVDDDGVDLVVNYRVRVQVKNSFRSAQERATGYWYTGYAWSSKHCWSEADVFLLRGDADDGGDRWWVVPASVLEGHGQNLVVYDGMVRGRGSVVAGFEDRWDVFVG